MRRFFACAFSFLLLIPTFTITLLAQEESETEVSNNEQLTYDISVTADRLEESLKDKTDSVTIITHDDIERHQWRYVHDALRDVAGLNVVQSGSPGKTTSLFLRGANSDQLLVLIDGVQVNDPFFGGVSIQDVTTDNIERIEIVRGPQSPLYGSDSIAGVINIVTRGGSSGLHTNASFEGGSFQTYREKAGLSGGTGKAAYSLTYSRQDTEGQFDNDEFDENSFSARTDFTLGAATELSVNGRVHDSHIGIPFSSANTPSPLRNQDTQLSTIGSNFDHSSGNFLNLKLRFGFCYQDFLFQDPEDSFSTLTAHTSQTFQVGLQNDFHIFEKDILIVGYEFEKETIDANDAGGPIPILNDFDSTIHAVYAQNKFESEHWIFTTGVRYDDHNTFGRSVNPRISAAFRPQPNWKIRGSFGTGFRAPTAGDLAFPFYGNPNLDPEKSKSWEIGLDHYWNESASFSASYFRNDYEDLITFDPNTFIAGNVAKARSQGLELFASIGHNLWHLSGSYIFLDTKDEIENHQLFRRPKNSGSVSVSYDASKWGATLRILAVGERLEADFSTFPRQNVFNPGYVKVDVSGQYRLTSWMKLHGRIENLLNDEYSEVLAFPAPGIAEYAGLEFGL
ncbi:TonB-dependent receptor [bacterium]|nr:TonB-dependent receptor [bacterium]